MVIGQYIVAIIGVTIGERFVEGRDVSSKELLRQVVSF